jgi:hypothetical protein
MLTYYHIYERLQLESPVLPSGRPVMCHTEVVVVKWVKVFPTYKCHEKYSLTLPQASTQDMFASDLQGRVELELCVLEFERRQQRAQFRRCQSNRVQAVAG